MLWAPASSARLPHALPLQPCALQNVLFGHVLHPASFALEDVSPILCGVAHALEMSFQIFSLYGTSVSPANKFFASTPSTQPFVIAFVSASDSAYEIQ